MSSEWELAESSGSWEDAPLSESWTGNDQDGEERDYDEEDDLRSSRRSVEARDEGRGKSVSSSDQIDPNDFDTFSINSTQAGGRKKKLNQAQVFAIKRLMKDYQELHAHPIPFVHAAPIDGNLFLWHGNLRGPANSPFEGGIFHIVITISEDYPSSPPSITLSNTIPHPFVFGNSVCLNLLQEASSPEPYSGWSPIYSIQSVLLQLQSFLLDGLEASQIPTGFNVSFSQKQASAWKVIFENRDKQGDGTLIPSEVRELMLEVGERKPSPAELALYYRMLNLPADHAIDFSQFLTILEKKREYRKVVEEANRYSCTHSKCHHRQQHPWPPYPEISESNFVSHQTESEMVLAETRCFFSKRSFLAPENETLGVGVSFTRNPRDGTVHSIDSSLDILSLRAFRKHKIHTSVDNQQTFTHWLPLYINKDHAPKCLHLLPRSLGIICAGSHHNFKPDMVLQVLPKLLSGLVLSLTKGEIYVSVKVLEGYSYFYRLFLAAARQYPEIKALCQEKYNNFLADPEHRTKKNISNISDFLSTISIVDSFDFSALALPILEEMDARSVPWILKKRPEFDCEPNAKVDRDRASASFELSFSGYQLLLVHKFLLENVAHPTGNSTDQIEEDLDSRFGRPRSDILDRFQLAIASIRNISSYKGLYRYLGIEVPSDEQIIQKLYASLQRSRDLFYHGPKQRSLTRPDDYAKFKLKDFASLESLLIDDPAAASSSSSAPAKVLMSNEEVWQDMAKTRFGVKELPQQEAALNPIQDPWRHLYLQLNLQELLNELNDNRDLKTLYHTIDISAPYLKVLEFTVCCVSNIKSGYHFLNPLLTRLQIEKLAIRNGEGTLGIKGCKNLCKGLQNNKQTLRIIDLHHTKFTPDCVAMLEAGILSCKNLISLNLEGNPLGSSGANTLAKILMYHQGITDLNISNCAIDQTGAKAISTALYHNKTLRTFRFGKNPVTTAGLAHILKNLAYSPSITSIDTGRTQASSSDRQLSDAVIRLLEVNTSLKSVNLYMTEIGPNFNNETLHAFAKNRSVSLIDMGSCNLNDNHCREIGKAVAINKNITTLILEQNNFSEAGVVNLTRSVYDKPKEIRRRNKLKSEGATLSDADLAEDLQPRGCSLVDINIANNTLSINSKTSMKALQRFISLTTTLTTLNLQNCSLQVLAGEALGNGLATHPSLVHLSLKGNRLGEHGIRKFCRAMAKNSVLKFLDLTSNDIGARGASAVCTLLEQPTIAIETLCLFGNLIGIEGARFLAKSIGINRSLKELDLGLNRIRPKGCLALAAGLRLNPTLQTLKLKLNFINDKAALALCASIIGTAEIVAQTSSSSSSSEEKKEEEKKVVVENVESVSSIKKLCLAGNRVKRAVLLQIAETFKESAKSIEIDVAQLLSVRTPARLARTVFLSPLPFDILETSLRKFFYEAGCGAIVNVAIINSTRDRSNFVYSKAKFAFVEFADIDSVEVAMEVEKGKCRIGRAVFKIIQAGKGITGKAKKASAASARDAPPSRGGRVSSADRRDRRGAGRGGRGRR